MSRKYEKRKLEKILERMPRWIGEDAGDRIGDGSTEDHKPHKKYPPRLRQRL